MPNTALQADTRIRQAVPGDLARIVALLAEDSSRPGCEDPSEPLAAGYAEAFAAIRDDPNNEILVLELEGHGIAGCCQITFLPGLSYKGAWRMAIEDVRIDARLRGRGLGRRFIGYAVARARERGCAIVQLTSNKRRLDAHRFYEQLGFERSHEGFKLSL